MNNNLLKDEKNPYLRMHKDQPIHWFPWGEEAFRKAETEDKPIFLSIGYSTCHWCHVMAKESFEDDQVAMILNEYFISIKVDREEHPEVDSVYMNFCQALTGTGGWPLSVFLTPQLKPFFAGTYFPKQSSKHRMGFLELLKIIAEKWEDDRSLLEKNANAIAEEVSSFTRNMPTDTLQNDLILSAVSILSREYDQRNGGFGNAPKFPTPHKLLFLSDYYMVEPSKKILEMLEHTAMQMAKGGMFDHIGGGFCRYSTDPYFLVPHFEKMLYDNALLILFYAGMFEITGKQIYLNIAEMTAYYLCNNMKSPNGGFYAAQDADSDGKEGLYYIFDRDEILNVLGMHNGTHFADKYDISEKGNFEGKNIPNLLSSDVDAYDFLINDSAKSRLSEYRNGRMELFTDQKILTSWNSMVISAFADLFRISGKVIYLSIAEEVLKDLREHVYHDGFILRGYYDDHLMAEGTIDDYAWYIHALIHLHQATLKDAYLDEALSCCRKANELFFDTKQGGYFQSAKNNTSLILEIKETYDGAIPSANSVMSENLRMLSLLSDDSEIEVSRKRQFAYMQRQVGNGADQSLFFVMSMNRHEHPMDKVIYVPQDDNDFEKHACDIKTRSIVKKVYGNKNYPLLNGKDTFYICDEFACRPGINNLRSISTE